MKNEEFSQECRQLNLKYRVLFGYIPRPSDYFYPSKDAYIDALKKSIESSNPIERYLEKIGKQIDPNSLT